MHTANDIDGLLLAGGQARRFGGQDKGLQDFRGLPMVEHVIRTIAPAVDSLVVSCNRNLPDYQRIVENPAYNRDDKPRHCVTDGDNALGGPLAGIAAAISHCSARWVFVCPCDMPLLPATCIDQLHRAVSGAGLAGAYAAGAQGQHYLLLLLDRRLASASLERLAISKTSSTKSLSVRNWLDSLGAQAVVLSDHPDCFVNINDAKKLKSLE